MLPSFQYHPDPIATGSVKPSPTTCICCGQARGYIYVASVYCCESICKQLCPWCIADGSAAKRYDAMFCDDHFLIKAGLAADIIAEVTRRTPGYISWQGEHWLSCCDDACEFHGDVSREELRGLSGSALDRFISGTGWTATEVAACAEHYQPGGSPAIYKFVCRHCKQPLYGYDCD
jgi:uncharacterized protein CbrC (UPF0167 family)